MPVRPEIHSITNVMTPIKISPDAVLAEVCIRVASFCTLRRLQMACTGISPRMTPTQTIAKIRITFDYGTVPEIWHFMPSRFPNSVGDDWRAGSHHALLR
jgi:hypothetical protein